MPIIHEPLCSQERYSWNVDYAERDTLIFYCPYCNLTKTESKGRKRVEYKQERWRLLLSKSFPPPPNEPLCSQKQHKWQLSIGTYRYTNTLIFFCHNCDMRKMVSEFGKRIDYQRTKTPRSVR